MVLKNEGNWNVDNLKSWPHVDVLYLEGGQADSGLVDDLYLYVGYGGVVCYV